MGPQFVGVSIGRTLKGSEIPSRDNIAFKVILSSR